MGMSLRKAKGRALRPGLSPFDLSGRLGLSTALESPPGSVAEAVGCGRRFRLGFLRPWSGSWCGRGAGQDEAEQPVLLAVGPGSEIDRVLMRDAVDSGADHQGPEPRNLKRLVVGAGHLS